MSIAFNDVRKLNEQLGYLDRNVVSIQKARDAYRQQFDIGQRSLLDLLNSENELYTAKRSYVLAEEDLATAIVRTYAGMGTLVASLGLKRPDAQDLAPEAQNWGIDGDASSRCPLDAIEVGGATLRPARRARRQDGRRPRARQRCARSRTPAVAGLGARRPRCAPVAAPAPWPRPRSRPPSPCSACRTGPPPG